jgi:hypothetical protein
MVLAQGNKEQNQHYPPAVFTTHFRLASDWLKDELVRLYPTSQTVIDLLKPYLVVKLIQLKNGKMAMPKVEYRNLIGVGFFVKDLEKCKPLAGDQFKFADPGQPTEEEIAELNAELEADSKSVRMVSQAEWDYFTAHPYKKPKTFDKAKGCIFDDNSIKVLPLGIPYVELRFVKKCDEFKYGYKPLPDETFVFDQETTTEEHWNENAIPYLFKAVNILYANYVRDTEYIASAKDLRDNSLF